MKLDSSEVEIASTLFSYETIVQNDQRTMFLDESSAVIVQSERV